MSVRTLRRTPVGGNAATPPAAVPSEQPKPLALAISALLNGAPHQPVELAPNIYVRAETICKALAPEMLDRIEALLAPEPQSIASARVASAVQSTDVVRRVGEYA